MKYYAFIIGIIVGVAINLPLVSAQNPFYFTSLQLGADPDNGECLTTDGTINVWSSSCGGGPGGTVYLASSSPWTVGNAAFVASNGALGSVATGTLTETVTGLEFNATRGLFGGSAALGLTSGFTIPSTTLITSASSFFATPSSLCTAITGSAALCDGDDATAGASVTYLASSTPWTTGNVAFVSGPGTVGSVATGTLSTGSSLSVTAGRSVLGGSATIDVASGFSIPTTTGLQALYASSHSAVTLAGTPDYITLAGQTITRALINLGTHITGILGIGNGGTGTSTSPSTDQILVGNVAGNYEYRRITAGTNVTVSTSTGGQIVISSTGGPSTVYLASTTPWTVGNAAFVSSNGALGSVATGTLTDSITGLSFSNQARSLFGGSADLALDAGYTIPQTNSLLTANSSTTGNLAFWSGNQTIGNVATGTLTEGVTGLELTATRALVGGAAVLNLTSGFVIPSTTGMTNLFSFYDSPGSRISLGNGFGWSSNTIVGSSSPSFSIASSTQGANGLSFSTGTSTLHLRNFPHGVTLVSWYCKASSTGSVSVRFGDGTNWTNAGSCSTTGGRITASTNNTFTADEDFQVQVGSSASSPSRVTITATLNHF